MRAFGAVPSHIDAFDRARMGRFTIVKRSSTEDLADAHLAAVRRGSILAGNLIADGRLKFTPAVRLCDMAAVNFSR